jgi:RNA-directed DNA polymerase
MNSERRVAGNGRTTYRIFLNLRDFLGWSFRKYGGKLLIRPSKKSVKAFLADTHKAILVDGRGVTQEELIRVLRPKIRGYAAYHRHTCCTETFGRIGHIMWQQPLRWACRRHPKKSAGWVRGRYWRKVGDNSWTFGTPEAFLAPITWQHVVRHPQVRADVNPYLDRSYCEERRRSLLLKRRDPLSTARPS